MTFPWGLTLLSFPKYSQNFHLISLSSPALTLNLAPLPPPLSSRRFRSSIQTGFLETFSESNHHLQSYLRRLSEPDDPDASWEEDSEGKTVEGREGKEEERERIRITKREQEKPPSPSNLSVFSRRALQKTFQRTRSGDQDESVLPQSRAIKASLKRNPFVDPPLESPSPRRPTSSLLGNPQGREIKDSRSVSFDPIQRSSSFDNLEEMHEIPSSEFSHWNRYDVLEGADFNGYSLENENPSKRRAGRARRAKVPFSPFSSSAFSSHLTSLLKVKREILPIFPFKKKKKNPFSFPWLF